MSSTAIADYGLLSDRHSAALVNRDGCVDWLCFPRFDGPSVFARLLDDDGGHWSIRPVEPYRVSRRYRDATMVLETTFRTCGGTLRLTDALVLGKDDGGHRIGVSVPRMLVREVTCTGGEVDVAVEYRPRPEYGLIRPLLSSLDGAVTARGGAEWLVLTTPVALTPGPGGATGRTRLVAGQTLRFALQRSTLDEQPAHAWEQEELATRLINTETAWRSWSALHQAYEGPWRDLVHHSGRVLQALSYQPSGAIVAAATTSLPEGVGGQRNWDYRYAWVRDGSLTMQALWVAACPDEAADFFSFMATAAPSFGRDLALQIMFGVGGEHDLTERILPHLTGWRGSHPVRVGNDAWSQQQIDIYGELLCAAQQLTCQLGTLDDDTRRFLVACADTAAQRWRDKDQGIWEVRSTPRHFLHSKVMCWAALDRGIELADLLNATERVDSWRRVREEIRDTVLREGWNDQVGAFTQYFGGTQLDAASLMLPTVGLLPADDPRMLATIDAIADRLTDDHGLVYRYPVGSGVDGLGGQEGTFLLCTFWLAQALAMSGQVRRARESFQRAIAHVNDLGLVAEEVDPETGELLGNFPQAFSHIGLINAAWAISQAESGAARPTG